VGWTRPGLPRHQSGHYLIGVLGVWFLLTRLGLRNWSAMPAPLVRAPPAGLRQCAGDRPQRQSVPVSAFVLGAGLLLGAEEQTRGARRAWFMFGSLVLVGIALVSKESAFAAPTFAPNPVLELDARTRRRSARDAEADQPGGPVFRARRRGVRRPHAGAARGWAAQLTTPTCWVVDWNTYKPDPGRVHQRRTGVGPLPDRLVDQKIWPRLAGCASLIGLALTIPWLAAAGRSWRQRWMVLGGRVLLFSGMALKIAHRELATSH